MQTQRVKVIDGGKIVVPASMRRELGMKIGDMVSVGIEDGELRVRSFERDLAEVRAIVRRYVPEGVSLVDELIAERRAEAALE